MNLKQKSIFCFFLFNLVFFNSVKANPVPTMSVKVLKRTNEHIETAALICSLIEDNSSQETIESAWSYKFDLPLGKDDKYLIDFVMKDMCPSSYQFYFLGD